MSSIKGKRTIIKRLQIYPIKSCRGIQVRSAILTRQGLKNDRKWMFVDAKHKFITIREKSEMTLIKTAIDEENQLLVVVFPARDGTDTTEPTDTTTIKVPLEPSDEYLRTECETIDVKIWGSDTDAYTYKSPVITDAVTSFFRSIDPDSHVKFVMKGPTPRQTAGNGAPEHLGRKETVNFPDVLPILVANQKSLDDVNARLQGKGEKDITVERFRPNVVVEGEGMEAWEEDRWRTLRFNPVGSSPPAPHPTSSSTSSTDDDDNNNKDDMKRNTLSSTGTTPHISPPTPFQSFIIWLFTNLLGLSWILPFLFRSSTITTSTSSSSTSPESSPSNPLLLLPIDVDVSARCARCHVPNVDPDTAVKNKDQPWNVLYNYRRVDKGITYKPCFGMLCCPRNEGVVVVGGTVEVSGVLGEGREHLYIKGF